MSASLTEWLSRLASISGDSRKVLIRQASSKHWDLQDFDEQVIRASPLPRLLADALSPYEVAVLQRVWKSDFQDKQWSRGTFDFLGHGTVQSLSEQHRESLPPARAVASIGEIGERQQVSANRGRRPASAGAIRRPAFAGRDVMHNDGPVASRSSARNVPVLRTLPKTCSSRWHEGRPVVSEGFLVEYMGGLLEVGASEVYYVDHAGQILVGHDGTTNPPCGIDGQPLIEDSDRQPMVQNTSPYKQNRQPFMQNVFPYGQNRDPFMQSASPNGHNRQPIVRNASPHRQGSIGNVSQWQPRQRGSPVQHRGFIGNRTAPKLSSNNWDEAQARVCDEGFVVKYGGGDLMVEANDIYYEDLTGRVLVGWNGTVSPPSDMDGLSLINESNAQASYPRSVDRHYPTRPDVGRVSELRRGPTRVSSKVWEQARPEVSDRPFVVKHAGSQLQVDANEVYYVDNLGRVLVGWKGSVSPPRDIDGYALVNC